MAPSTSPARSRLVLAGAIAAGPGLLVLVLSSLIISSAGFIEVVADGVTAYIPVEIFRTGLETFGPLAKGLLHLGVAVGIVLAGALLAVPAVRLTRASGWVGAGVRIGLAGLLLAEVVVLPIFGAGFFGTDLLTDPLAVHAPLALGSFVYGLLLASLRDRMLAEAARKPRKPRRLQAQPDRSSSRAPRRASVRLPGSAAGACSAAPSC